MAPSLKYRFIRSYTDLKNASWHRFLLDVANLAATAWVVYVPSRVAYARITNKPYMPTIWLFMLASLFLLVHKYFLRNLPGTEQWVRQDEMRKRQIQEAINKITECIYTERFTPLALFQTENFILTVILSHVRSVLRDTLSYTNVTLVVEHPTDSELMLVLNRAQGDRPAGVTYPKAGFLAWQTMQHPDKYSYHAKVTFEGKPYHSILIFPIPDLHIAKAKVALGAICIDSAAKDHLGAYKDDFNVSLLPHIANLRTILLLRRKHNVWTD